MTHKQVTSNSRQLKWLLQKLQLSKLGGMPATETAADQFVDGSKMVAFRDLTETAAMMEG